jgi:hypothetical protein
MGDVVFKIDIPFAKAEHSQMVYNTLIVDTELREGFSIFFYFLFFCVNFFTAVRFGAKILQRAEQCLYSDLLCQECQNLAD